MLHVFETQKALPLVAYTFSNGPWRALLVRYGYDPRVNPQSRSWQVLSSIRISLCWTTKINPFCQIFKFRMNAPQGKKDLEGTLLGQPLRVQNVFQIYQLDEG